MPATLETVEDASGGAGTLRLSGRLDADGAASLWREADAWARRGAAGGAIVDATGVDYCDGAGAGLLIHLHRIRAKAGGLEIRGLAPELRALLDLYDPDSFATETRAPRGAPGLAVQTGRAAVRTWLDFREQVSFVGELTVATAGALLRPARVRWRDAFRTAETAGADALPIVFLVAFLMGLILAAQAAVQMKQYGAEIYIADLIAISMLKELGPLVTAIVLAGRTGSAFAAEIGTMKINEEVNALKTMGLDPVRFLAVTRVLAAVTVTPLLSVFANVAGLLGGALVFVSFGYPLASYAKRVAEATDVNDFLGGLVKALVYGIIVASVGTLRGIQTGSGARAVGESTTSAVVTSIVLIAIAAGIFSIVYTALGI